MYKEIGFSYDKNLKGSRYTLFSKVLSFNLYFQCLKKMRGPNMHINIAKREYFCCGYLLQNLSKTFSSVCVCV